MSIVVLLWRTMKWRFHHAITILITLLQPLLWLVLYGAVAGGAMKRMGITNYTAFLLPGLLILVCFGACSSGGMMNYLMKADGSFYRVLIAPVRRSSIVLGHLLEVVLCAFLEVFALFAASLLFSVRVAAGPVEMLWILLFVFLSAFFIAALTYALSLTLPNEVLFETVMNAIVLPVFFLSTALIPMESLSGALKTVVALNPFTHVINMLRSLLLHGSASYSAMLLNAALLACLCAASFLWALHRLKRQTEY